MLRAFVFSIVLLLATGQDTALLCRLWCHPVGAVMAECQAEAHNNTAPSVTGDDGCGRMTVNAPILVREDLRRVFDQDMRSAAVIPRYEAPVLPSELHHGTDTSRVLQREPRPLLALRI